MQIQTWHPPLRLCIHAKYYVKSGLTNVLKNANKTKNMHLFSIRIANYQARQKVTTKITISIIDEYHGHVFRVLKRTVLSKHFF